MNYINSTKKRQQNGQSAAVIRYDETDGGTPSIIAQGTGVLAERIIELARQHGVQMQEDEQLVQHLLDLDLGDNIPPQLYSVIAEILLLIEEMGMKD
ncbi:EscU/YscU/HrcU family type III secretion system export apparatus switch protein [Rossellomorea marisflavi]|uniref:EscU/YscU/HrcU family type III secretion system export apparatus switch protein n=1 Tax=Rossellomorea marisflavi TaxID=189381 RepID=UPI0027AA3DA6|nr:EscU/YscU/HrcU family type III secretion system export apparatus switch protein [Rossellomorea marisflavi]UTE73589.1 EscU/YscU/HrcU family type III secretion system export apparatus switch protein [Rossellomorea marisflavi]